MLLKLVEPSKAWGSSFSVTHCIVVCNVVCDVVVVVVVVFDFVVVQVMTEKDWHEALSNVPSYKAGLPKDMHNPNHGT